MLKIDNLYYWHNVEHSLLNGIDLTLQKGELLTILGANGRGKSTLLNCIAGLLKPKSGQILLDNCKLSEMSSKQIAKKLLMSRNTAHKPINIVYVIMWYSVELRI